MVQQSPKSTPSRKTPKGSNRVKPSWTKCETCGIKTVSNHECDTVGTCIGESTVKLMSVYKDTVYCHLHPDTMREIGIKIGSFVRIDSDVLECWPDPSILLDNVGYASQERALVNLTLIDSIKSASQVTVVIDGKLDKSYLPFVLQNKVVFRGQQLSVPYFTKAVKITVDRITTANPVNAQNGAAHADIDDISLQLVNSSLRDNYYQILTSTSFVEKEPMLELPSIIGADKVMQKVQKVLDFCLRTPKSFGCMGPPKTLVVTGPSGSGKTLLCKTMLQSNDEFISETVHDFSKPISKEEHCKIILLDGLDSIRDDDSTKIENVSNFLRVLPDSVLVLASAVTVPPALRKYFPLQVQMPAVTSEMRLEIFTHYLKTYSDSVSAEDIEVLSSKSNGHVGADICNVCRQALILADTEPLTLLHLLTAVTKVPPCSMNDIKIEVPEVRWKDIGGLKQVQQLLTEVISWPIIHHQKYTQMGITPPKGVLLYGPPGCCKTMMAKALATESGLNFLSVKGPELLSMYVGESERAIRDLFAKARAAAPAIVFFDEIDALATHRGAERGSGVNDRVLAQLLTELDGVEGLTSVVVVAATNRPDRIDKALLRPGRLEKLVHIPLPDLDCRLEIFKLKFSRIPHEGIDFEKCARLTEGFSGAEVVAVCHAAAIQSIASGVVTSDNLEVIIDSTHPQTSVESIMLYAEFSKNKL